MDTHHLGQGVVLEVDREREDLYVLIPVQDDHPFALDELDAALAGHGLVMLDEEECSSELTATGHIKVWCIDTNGGSE